MYTNTTNLFLYLHFDGFRILLLISLIISQISTVGFPKAKAICTDERSVIIFPVITLDPKATPYKLIPVIFYFKLNQIRFVVIDFWYSVSEKGHEIC